MSIHISQVIDYLDSHPVSKYPGNFESFLDMIHAIYTDSNPIENEQIYSALSEIATPMQLLSNEDSDDLFAAISTLCLEYERASFSHGLLAGMLLMTELNSLP